MASKRRPRTKRAQLGRLEAQAQVVTDPRTRALPGQLGQRIIQPKSTQHVERHDQQDQHAAKNHDTAGIFEHHRLTTFQISTLHRNTLLGENMGPWQRRR